MEDIIGILRYNSFIELPGANQILGQMLYKVRTAASRKIIYCHLDSERK